MKLRAVLDAPPFRARTADPDAALVAAAREEPQAFLALYDRYSNSISSRSKLPERNVA